ncbi:MAG: sulfate adenylyltransferase [Proteobacteria bacterium SG_bin7]|nr:MAG: sulfate adenylyltransferase [Proteobacteria bacterium SG_bin7]
MSSHLDELESKGIFILREAHANFRDLGMLWSIGKDSTVLLWLARKAFFDKIPFPLIHIDTDYKIPEMIAYRDQLALTWKLDLIVGKNVEALQKKQTYADGYIDRVSCCRSLKTQALQQTIDGSGPQYRLNLQTEKFDELKEKRHFSGLILGIRADEEGSRSKERYFSPRDTNNHWQIIEQPPEFWNQFNTDIAPNSHVRIHPLLDWTEVNIWEYIYRERIPTVSLYYDQGKGSRYRSLGCYPCTFPVTSKAKSPEEIIFELKSGKFSKVAERAGRAQDREDGGGLETLRKEGYM